MRLGSEKTSDGECRAVGIVDEEGLGYVVDIERSSGGELPKDILELITKSPRILDSVRKVVSEANTLRPLEEVRLCAPIPRPGKVVCVASNYRAHIEEFGGSAPDKNRVVPKLFIKPSTTIIGPNDRFYLPSVSGAVDWEIELAVVIGKRGRDIPLSEAGQHIFGYAIVNDFSARVMDWGITDRVTDDMDGFFDWLVGKWGDGFAPFGPWITTREAVVADPNDLKMRLEVNGEVWQEGSTADMIFTPEEVISFGSQFMTWEPGDVIACGTLDGTGHPKGVYLRAGDRVVASIEGLGALSTPVVDGSRVTV